MYNRYEGQTHYDRIRDGPHSGVVPGTQAEFYLMIPHFLNSELWFIFAPNVLNSNVVSRKYDRKFKYQFSIRGILESRL